MFSNKTAIENHNYWNDSRVRASMRRGVWKVIQQGTHDAIIALDFDLFDDFFYDHEEMDQSELGIFTHDGHEYCIKVSMKYEVCDECGGAGTVVNPDIDCGGISREDFDADPEFESDYFEGRFDIKCPACDGLRVNAMPEFPEWLQKVIDDHDRCEAAHIAEVCAERRMGA